MENKRKIVIDYILKADDKVIDMIYCFLIKYYRI